MKEKSMSLLKISIALLLVFLLFTAAIKAIDVKTVVPGIVENDELLSWPAESAADPDNESCFSLGFSGLNLKLATIIGYNHGFEVITELLGYISLLLVGVFGSIGLMQLINRKNLLKVDANILVLGVYFVLVLALYFMFDKLIINYRPYVFDKGLEASYPSSHTMLVVAVMSVVPRQVRLVFGKRLPWARLVTPVCFSLIPIMTVCRLLAGVHWFTDITGGLLLAFSMVMLYRTAMSVFCAGTDECPKEKRATAENKPGRGGAHLAK